jgi:epoxyqueuosine reductase QueG
VVVFAIAFPKGMVEVSPRIIYPRCTETGMTELDRIAFLSSREVEKKFDAVAVPIPSDGPYDYWDSEKLEGRGILSMKHAAVLAGLGTLGKNTLLMNSKYGNMLGIGAVLTNLDLSSDPPAEKICKKDCRLCLDSCPVHALDGITATQLQCRPCAYGTNDKGFFVVNCNKCRVVCPMKFGKA